MNAFERFLLTFAKAAAAAAPYAAPIFVHSSRGVAIFNVSEAFGSAMLDSFTPPPPPATQPLVLPQIG